MKNIKQKLTKNRKRNVNVDVKNVKVFYVNSKVKKNLNVNANVKTLKLFYVDKNVKQFFLFYVLRKKRKTSNVK